MHFDFNNQFIKATRTNQNFKKKTPKEIILFSFNIKDYALLCKA